MHIGLRQATLPAASSCPVAPITRNVVMESLASLSAYNHAPAGSSAMNLGVRPCEAVDGRRARERFRALRPIMEDFMP